MFGEDCFKTIMDENTPIINRFPKELSYEDCSSILNGIGLTSVVCWVRPVKRRKKDKDGQDEPLFVCVSYNQLVLPPKFQPYVRVVQKKKGKTDV